ncbi:hypothetical protein FZEAL_70 [Fusarium zealandicum]|uniref:Isochorismatase-like domain-containing protein n=1 Tax=Fusarium zealandicum TaxID=1053134 RepID=A0A8H4XQR1_9HYPO|nr:hypothetical protein FZEAL_70 [Fusarium zealandicum]
MKISPFVSMGFLSAVALATSNSGFTYERLDKNDAVLLVVGIQEGLYQLVSDFDPTVYRQQAIAHASLAELFSLPVVMTTSADTGPNGPLFREMREMHPNTTMVQRMGEVNAWDNKGFQEAVRATNKSQVILGGILTDVCTTFLALSLREAGFSAGVHTMSTAALLGELMRDWRGNPGYKEIFPWLDKHVPLNAHLARAHGYAVINGTVAPGQDEMLG